MRKMQFLAALAAVALWLSAGAFARDTNSGKFDLAQQAKVGSTMLQPGSYKAEWTGNNNNNLNINIVKNGKTVATAQGQLKELPSKSPYSAVTLRNLANHTSRVDEIDFNNRTEALVLRGM